MAKGKERLPGLVGVNGDEGFENRGEVGTRRRLGWDTGEFGRKQGDEFGMAKAPGGLDEEEHAGEVVAMSVSEAKEKGEGILISSPGAKPLD